MKIMNSKKTPTETTVKILKWVAWVATALISFLTGSQI